MNRLLVANRGEIARRVFATCRRLGISTVAVYSEPDADALFVLEADVAVALGGASAAESYLRSDAVIGAALQADADAIHPGYGFLSESASFAQAVIDSGLLWIGPSPAAIAAMGSKTEARERMQAAGVPVLPGCRLDGHVDGAIDRAAEAVGYPLLVKASAGGGGKGMRLVTNPGELHGGIAAARREAASAFGDDTVFLERYAVPSRHVEIQIMGDTRGRVVSLHERDCSVQRRHQKIIEESPSPVVDGDLRARMSAAAIAAGEAIGYVGAGTVEFLVTRSGASAGPQGEFFFLEVNTRLQVEHPVTELITGLDLVELQLLVAEGRPLPDQALEAPLIGHAIEARLYAEDPANNFLPVTGTLSTFEIDGDGAVRVDTGVRDGSVITPYYDPMIAKVIAHGATREEAARKLTATLSGARLHGMTTNRDFLVRVLRHPEFLAGGADTSFLERHADSELEAPLISSGAEMTAAAAAALAAQAGRRAAARTQRTLPSGWRNNPSQLQYSAYRSQQHGELRVGYRFDRDGGLAELQVDGVELECVRLRHCAADEVDFEIAGLRRRYRVCPAGDGLVYVNTAEGQVALRELSRFPDPDAGTPAGSLESPMPGAVIRVLAAAGDEVKAGQPLLVIEAMKMEQEILANIDGILIELNVAEGMQVEAGAVLAVIGANR